MNLALASVFILVIGDSNSVTDAELTSYSDLSLHHIVNIAEDGTGSGYWNTNYASLVTPAIQDNSVRATHIMLGTIDAGASVSAATFRTNMDAIVTALLADGQTDIVLSLPPYEQGGGASADARNALLDDYAIEIAAMDAASANVRVGVDFVADVSLPYPDVWIDTVHPNQEGHHVMSREFDGHFTFVPEPKQSLLSAISILAVVLLKERRRCIAG